MARKTEVIEHFVDDLDGTRAEESVTFTYAGQSYELDLNKKNAKAFHADHGKWATAGRKVRAKAPVRRKSAPGKTSAVANLSGEIRAWAAEHGIDVPARGRISAAVREQWEAATK